MTLLSSYGGGRGGKCMSGMVFSCARMVSLERTRDDAAWARVAQIKLPQFWRGGT
jgi:hypothetical protein